MDINVDNVGSVKAEALRKHVFELVEVHVDYTSLDKDRFMYLLGYYPAMYNYVSELFTVLIQKVRELSEVGDKFGAARARDKRDILDAALRTIKLQYDSLSRKITLLQPGARE